MNYLQIITTALGALMMGWAVGYLQGRHRGRYEGRAIERMTRFTTDRIDFSKVELTEDPETEKEFEYGKNLVTGTMQGYVMKGAASVVELHCYKITAGVVVDGKIGFNEFEIYTVAPSEADARKMFAQEYPKAYVKQVELADDWAKKQLVNSIKGPGQTLASLITPPPEQGAGMPVAPKPNQPDPLWVVSCVVQGRGSVQYLVMGKDSYEARAYVESRFPPVKTFWVEPHVEGREYDPEPLRLWPDQMSPYPPDLKESLKQAAASVPDAVQYAGRYERHHKDPK